MLSPSPLATATMKWKIRSRPTLWRMLYSLRGHFYLQDCYPLQFINDEQVQANIKKNAEMWDTFVNYLEKIGKIKQ